MREYEKLSNTNDYSLYLRKTDNYYSKINNLNALKGCYLLMRLGNSLSIDYLKELGVIYDKVNISNLSLLRSKILSLQTRIQIDSVIKDETKSNDIHTYEDVIINLENALGRNLKNDMTLSEYVAIVKSLEKRNDKQTEKQK